MFTTQSGTYDSCEESEECSVMEFCKNKSLNLKLKRKKPNQICSIVEKNTQNREKFQSVWEFRPVGIRESHCVPCCVNVSSDGRENISVKSLECLLWAMSCHRVTRRLSPQAQLYLLKTKQLLKDSESEWKATERCRLLGCLSMNRLWTIWTLNKCKKL